ncbi:CRISPR-associated endonuclease Cas2 [Brevibacillus borstelensis]|uniref:CRISPR-associated endonuclease Cas2 n=2 Tax=Brevibacillus borstelensis TaxID=45462 RepID=UPI000A51E3D6
MVRQARFVCAKQVEVTRMSGKMKYYLVCYDIREPKRWKKCFRLVKGYGERIQYSVFQCYLSERAMAQLRWELAKILSKEDSLLIAPIYAPDQNKIIQWNMSAEWSPDRERFKTL